MLQSSPPPAPRHWMEDPFAFTIKLHCLGCHWCIPCKVRALGLGCGLGLALSSNVRLSHHQMKVNFLFAVIHAKALDVIERNQRRVPLAAIGVH